MEGAESIHLFDIYPCLHDRTQITKADYYFYQDIWAFKRIYESKVKHHVDVGSRAIFVGMLTAFTNVTFIDIRPLEANLAGLECIKGNILSMPFEDKSLRSLSSCLCVAEHIGLGRYGDSLDPMGTKKSNKGVVESIGCEWKSIFLSARGQTKIMFQCSSYSFTKTDYQLFQG